MANINNIESPKYTEMFSQWEAFRLTGEGGEKFLDKYLKKWREELSESFRDRKAITYIPSYAKAAVNQVNNSLSQRLSAVERVGGSENYQRAMLGMDAGVDRAKRSMNRFLTSEVIPELTMMGGVGVLIDAPKDKPKNKQEEQFFSPYLYTYRVEDIKAWSMDPENMTQFTSLLLVDHVQVLDEDYGLTTDSQERYRLYTQNKGKVTLTLFNEEGVQEKTEKLNISEIPFVYLQINGSLLSDIYRHQIALLNLGSADMLQAWSGNFPIYAEQYDPKDVSEYFRETPADEKEGSEAGSVDAQSPRDGSTRYVGSNQGIKINKNLEYPKYISPDSAPLAISIQKQDQVKNQISEIVNQNLKSVTSKNSSAESKEVEERREEDGLKSIGDELEYAEDKISHIWSKYEGTDDIAEVNYPCDYQFLSSTDKREKAKDLAALMLLTPSKTAQKAIAKKIIQTIIGQSSTEEDLAKMYAEIDSAEGTISDPLAIAKLIEMDILDTETGATQIGFTAEVAKKARLDRIERAKEIAIKQSEASDNPGARGIDDLSVNPEQDAKGEKANVPAE